ncbi:hypothetical protein [Dictyobacter formicarum]|uniref:Secreted protein n=1 Tax=Dictyobacter formicarum TaxID=2778368 RepID=A0ABQ3VK60_9CHLR|nr:hypothetical protein [Dictyobacter formicarum]GHO86302.1 hypothetical protein KSZ_43080 [Dictyobacter formicarum]
MPVLPAAVMMVVVMPVVVMMVVTIETIAIKVTAHIGAAEEEPWSVWAIVAVAHPAPGPEQAAQTGEKYQKE